MEKNDIKSNLPFSGNPFKICEYIIDRIKESLESKEIDVSLEAAGTEFDNPGVFASIESITPLSGSGKNTRVKSKDTRTGMLQTKRIFSFKATTKWVVAGTSREDVHDIAGELYKTIQTNRMTISGHYKALSDRIYIDGNEFLSGGDERELGRSKGSVSTMTLKFSHIIKVELIEYVIPIRGVRVFARAPRDIYSGEFTRDINSTDFYIPVDNSFQIITSIYSIYVEREGRKIVLLKDTDYLVKRNPSTGGLYIQWVNEEGNITPLHEETFEIDYEVSILVSSTPNLVTE